MLCLVDGYNVTKGDPSTRDSSLQDQREMLLTRLRARGRELLGQKDIIVVFDGVGGMGISRAGSAPVDVRFSRDRPADDLIVEIAAASKHKVLLVTSDRELVARVRIHCAHAVQQLGREVLFEASAPVRARRSSTRYPARTVGMPEGHNKVTEELKGIWLTDDEE
ncbi:MAG: NYN domain-containing protein [Coriobacteriia bacterium]|nr:NYN domain-containing protein [Coriobacteriia bacterium]